MYVSGAIRRSSQTNDGVCFSTYASRRRSIHPECGTCTLLPSQVWRRQTMSVKVEQFVPRAGWVGISTQLGGPCWVLCNRTKPCCNHHRAVRPRPAADNVRSTPPCSSSSACTICAAAIVTVLSVLLTRFMYWDIASDCSRVVRGRPYDSGSYYKLLTPMMPLFVDLLLF